MKERNKDDHLYVNKDKFVTSAYKKKLAEQAKWMEKERSRQLREITKKSDLSDFHFNLGKNVAFGANEAGPRKPEMQTELRKPEKKDEKEIDVFKRVQPLLDSNVPQSSGVTNRT